MQPPRAARPSRVAFIGFGALAETFASALRDASVPAVSAYTRPRSDDAARSALQRRAAAAGVQTCASIAEAVADAEIVVAAVPAGAAAEVASACAPSLARGCLYLDPSPLMPQVKAELSRLVEDAGGEYVDLAVLGTVATSGAAVPLLAAGPGAVRWAAVATPLGFRVTAVDGEAGCAALVKLLRSVYMKGRDALILEMLLAARRHGVEEAVVSSIGGSGEQVPFPELAARVTTSLAVYAERRAEELAAAAAVVAEAGLDPLVTRAGAERLRWLADLGLREHFGRERPEDPALVLEAVEARAGERERRA